MDRYDVAIIGSGFVGSSLAVYLSNYFSVKTFDILPQHSSLKNLSIPHEQLDITKNNELSKKIGNPTVVLHCAIIQIPKINENKQLGYDVNVVGTQNICEFVSQNTSTKGMILISSWHTYGEQNLSGILSENIGYKPDMVEDRAKLYALSKTIQECLVRFFDEKTPDKIFGGLKIGTVLGEGMPKGTAANLFIDKSLSGEKLTPFRHSIYRPMLYVSIEDICDAVKNFVNLIQKNTESTTKSIDHIMNLAYPKPITILDLAELVVESVTKLSKNKIKPEISIIDKGIPEIGHPNDKNSINLDVSKVQNILGLEKITEPKEQIEKLIQKKLLSD